MQQAQRRVAARLRARHVNASALLFALAIGAPRVEGTVTDIDGNAVDLAAKYRGKVLVVVNVASECG